MQKMKPLTLKFVQWEFGNFNVAIWKKGFMTIQFDKMPKAMLAPPTPNYNNNPK